MSFIKNNEVLKPREKSLSLSLKPLSQSLFQAFSLSHSFFLSLSIYIYIKYQYE